MNEPNTTDTFTHTDDNYMADLRLAVSNIADLLNVSRGDVAYTLVDLDAPASDETLQRISSIDGILRVRVLPLLESVSRSG